MWSHHHYLSLASRNKRLIRVSTVTSYQLHPFLPLPCHYVFPHHLLLPGFKKCQAYHSCHSYQLPNIPCLSVCHYHSFSLWPQVMNDLLKFPQLPVTSYTLSSLASMWSHHHSLSIWLQGIKDLSKFPQLPVTSYTLSSLYLATMCFHIIYYSPASSNVRLTTVPTVTSYLTALVSLCVIITLSLSGFK